MKMQKRKKNFDTIPFIPEFLISFGIMGDGSCFDICQTRCTMIKRECELSELSE